MGMFGGHDDTTPSAQPSAAGAPQDDTLNGVADLVGGTAIPGPGDAGYQSPMPPQPAQPSFSMTTPPLPATPAPAQNNDQPAPEQPSSDKPGEESTPDASASASMTDDDDLLEMKQQALRQLSPLVGQLDQSPEEKFRTTMMLIQAADNKDLLKEAYEAALEIGDEKEKAQALLDVINEINYFTQKSKD